jgi:hypothetical protein
MPSIDSGLIRSCDAPIWSFYPNGGFLVKPPRGKPRGILKRMAELSIAISPPSLKLRRALLAIHPRGKPRGILAKESK